MASRICRLVQHSRAASYCGCNAAAARAPVIFELLADDVKQVSDDDEGNSIAVEGTIHRVRQLVIVEVSIRLL